MEKPIFFIQKIINSKKLTRLILAIKRLFLIIFHIFSAKVNIPENFRINGRVKLASYEFKTDEKLFRGFKKSDFENGHLKLETIKFPDISCNWERFSNPTDIWYRKNGSFKDGCYSITVDDSRFEKIATPVHDPIFPTDDDADENYSHTEIRVLGQGMTVFNEPEKNKKLSSKIKKLQYRQHIQEIAKIEIKAL